MATIEISELRPAGSDLFSDSDNYMNELCDSEYETISGGLTPSLVWSAATAAARISSLRCAGVSAAGVGVVAGGISGWFTGEK